MGVYINVDRISLPEAAVYVFAKLSTKQRAKCVLEEMYRRKPATREAITPSIGFETASSSCLIIVVRRRYLPGPEAVPSPFNISSVGYFLDQSNIQGL